MDEGKGIATPMITRFIFWDDNVLIDFYKELEKYLRRTLRKIYFKGKFSYYDCFGCDIDDLEPRFRMTMAFCRDKGIDFQTFYEILEDSLFELHCEADLVNEFTVDHLIYGRNVKQNKS